MKTILITGSLGLTGQACVDLFSEKGWNVIGIDNNGRAGFYGTEKRKPQGNQRFIEMDIRDTYALADLFEDHTFDAIIHTAAQPSHDYATDHILEDFEINTMGTLNLLQTAKMFCSEATFVFVSTDKVYGENMTAPLEEEETRFSLREGIVDESDPPVWSKNGFTEELGLDFAGDRSFFGCSKVSADLYAQQYAARFGMNIGIFRPGCITGKNHAGAEQHGFLAYLTKCIKEGKTYKIYGFKGKQVRDQIHAVDLASAFYEYIQRPISTAVYNIGGGLERSVSVLEAGQYIADKLGKPFNYEIHEARKGDRCYDVHDVSKFRKDYPQWDYKYSLQDIIDDLCEV